VTHRGPCQPLPFCDAVICTLYVKAFSSLTPTFGRWEMSAALQGSCSFSLPRYCFCSRMSYEPRGTGFPTRLRQCGTGRKALWLCCSLETVSRALLHPPQCWVAWRHAGGEAESGGMKVRVYRGEQKARGSSGVGSAASSPFCLPQPMLIRR